LPPLSATAVSVVSAALNEDQPVALNQAFTKSLEATLEQLKADKV